MQVIGGETQLLVEQAAGGDEEAQGELLERLRPRVVLWCANRMSDRLRAKTHPEDLAQEVLLALHKALPSLEIRGDRGAFLGWVFKVAENRIRDLANYHGAQKRQTIEPRSFHQTSPSLAAARSEMTEKLLQAMAGLTEDYRQVIQLRKLEELGVEEVAQIMKRSTGATHTLYWRAIEALRGEMRKQGSLPAEFEI